jgi:hypothetical protein
MIEMRVREKDVERVGLAMLAQATDSGASIKYDAALWQEIAGRVPSGCRVVSAGAEKDELHGATGSWEAV